MTFCSEFLLQRSQNYSSIPSIHEHLHSESLKATNIRTDVKVCVCIRSILTMRERGRLCVVPNCKVERECVYFEKERLVREQCYECITINVCQYDISRKRRRRMVYMRAYVIDKQSRGWLNQPERERVRKGLKKML